VPESADAHQPSHGRSGHADDLADRPSAARGDPVPVLSNAELAAVFREIGDLVELKGEVVFKAQAYRRAADAIADAREPVAEAYRRGEPPALPGVGRAIADKLAELADTGRLAFHERLREEVPPSLLDLLAVPGLGPRTVHDLHAALGITTLEDLAAAAQAGRIRGVRGLGPKTEERILDALAGLGARAVRMRLGEAADRLGAIMGALARTPGLDALIPAGSFRRRRETIGDLDLLAEADASDELIAAFTSLPGVSKVLASGPQKGAVQLRGGPQVDLMVMPPGEAGAYLVHFTGSAAHNVRLRGLARDRGWSLSEHGFVRLGPDGRALEGAEAERQTFATEAEVYAFLDLPFVEPELREDTGEIEAAQAGSLPDLVRLADLQGDAHSHSDWSDGHLTVEQVAEVTRRRGHAFQVLTDHSRSLTIARGLTIERVEQQRLLIAELNERFAREEATGETPEGAHPDGFRLLHGCEMEIRVDGELDYPDELLARYDVVVASLHVGRRQPRAQLMARYRTALRNRHVDIIAHPSGRKIGTRDDLDLDWDSLFEQAAETATLLEVNGSDERLDLADSRIRRARERGCRFVIDSDAHYRHEYDNLAWGVAIARRGWLEADDVLNTRSREPFLAWMRGDRSV
jgi:DNA polymerase (family 10)